MKLLSCILPHTQEEGPSGDWSWWIMVLEGNRLGGSVICLRSCCGSVDKTTDSHSGVPGSNLPAVAVVPLGKQLAFLAAR